MKNYYVEASGFFLTRPFPEDWNDESYWEDTKWADLYDFIDDHITEHYEDWDTYLIEEEIEKLSNLLFETVEAFAKKVYVGDLSEEVSDE
tara:strand:+ start:692 stop:961 length:270 start_codon:yes stop_codon:yes gene_type:complete